MIFPTMSGPRFSERRRQVLGLAVALALLVPLAAGAGGRLFVSISGIRGTSTVTGFEQQVEAVAVSFSGSAATGAPALGLISVTKLVDISTPVFLDAFAKGKVFPTVIITNAVPINSRSTVSERYTLTNVKIIDVRIADFTTNASGRGTEQLTLSATTLRMEASEFDLQSGNKIGSTTGTLP